MRPEPGAARAALRAATAAAHERLHVLPPFAALADGKLGRTEYVALLGRLLGFHAAVEARLAAAPSLIGYGIDLTERRRAPLLLQDLAAMGAPPATAETQLPWLGTAPMAMGCLYVTEGSTLGGRLLARGLDRLLGSGTAGRSFLLGRGARHGALWQSFCLALERCGAEPDGVDGMVGGADMTFTAFERWFSGPWWPGESAAPPPF
jgi:heme oxygenase